MNRATVTVTGAGVMGSQISQVFAVHGFQVRVHDVSSGQLETAKDRIENGRFGVAAAVSKGRMTESDAAAALARLSYHTDLEQACEGAALIQEAVPEDIGLKVRVFRALDSAAPADAILVSNTASLPVTGLAYATDRPHLVFGWHWFQPCVAMKCAELVVHPAVDSAALTAVRDIATQCGKNVVVVNDGGSAPGFVANRISYAIRREADLIVAEQVASTDQVDAIMRDAFRWPMGPFELRGQSTLG